GRGVGTACRGPGRCRSCWRRGRRSGGGLLLWRRRGFALRLARSTRDRAGAGGFPRLSDHLFGWTRGTIRRRFALGGGGAGTSTARVRKECIDVLLRRSDDSDQLPYGPGVTLIDQSLPQ